MCCFTNNADTTSIRRWYGNRTDEQEPVGCKDKSYRIVEGLVDEIEPMVDVERDTHCDRWNVRQEEYA